MNTKLTFRLFNKNSMQFIFNPDINYLKQYITFSSNMGINDLIQKIIDSDNFIIQQCTGITDKYEKFVYEGDILQDDKGKQAIICWFEDNAQFIAVDMSEYIYGNKLEPAYIFNDVWSNAEIIGNICN